MNVQLGIFDAGVKLRFRSNDESIIVGAIHYKELRKYELVIAEKEIVQSYSERNSHEGSLFNPFGSFYGALNWCNCTFSNSPRLSCH